MDKKRLQLGMNPGTASHRLVKDLLYEYAVAREGAKCFHCGYHMTREDFSIEHKEPWLDSDDPVGLYFDIENIAFSHKRCNYAAKRIPHKKYFTESDRKKHAAEKSRVRWRALPKEVQQHIRREKYLRNGK